MFKRIFIALAAMIGLSGCYISDRSLVPTDKALALSEIVGNEARLVLETRITNVNAAGQSGKNFTVNEDEIRFFDFQSGNRNIYGFQYTIDDVVPNDRTYSFGFIGLTSEGFWLAFAECPEARDQNLDNNNREDSCAIHDFDSVIQVLQRDNPDTIENLQKIDYAYFTRYDEVT